MFSPTISIRLKRSRGRFGGRSIPAGNGPETDARKMLTHDKPGGTEKRVWQNMAARIEASHFQHHECTRYSFYRSTSRRTRS